MSRPWPGLILAPLLLGAALARASAPVTWEYPARGGAAPAAREPAAGRTAGPAAETGAAKADGVAMGANGALTLSAPLREIYPAAAKITAPPILWSAAADGEGGLFVGAGNTGEVIRIDAKGTGAGFADTEELGVRALVKEPGGDLYVATFPNGGVYRVSPGGMAEAYFDPEDRYVWSMVIDPAGSLFVGTGERGLLYRVLDKGESKILFDSDETHITSLAFDTGGRLLAGTAPGGLLYRIGMDGAGELLLDTDLAEISAITVAPDGAVYAAAIGEEPVQPPPRPGEKSDLRIELTPASDGNLLEEQEELPRKITIDLSELMPARGGVVMGTAGRLYRIAPGGAPEVLWKSDVERIYALAWSGARGLVFGTGGQASEARIYRLETDGTASLLHRLRDSQVTALLPQPGGRLHVCTSNPGRVYLLDTGSAVSGSWSSTVLDAGGRARWGAISWSAETPPGTRLELSTRSGNRPDPDESWSTWTPPYASDRGSQIVSPAGRYLQWRAELSRLKTETSPLLRKVTVTLLPDNHAPEVTSVAVLAAGAALPEPRAGRGAAAGSEAPSGRTPEAVSDKEADKGADKGSASPGPPAGGAPPPGSRWVTWVSNDADADALSHAIWLKGPLGGGGGSAPAGEAAAFRRIATGISSSPWALDQGSLAEGPYLLKVEADDLGVNGPETGRRDEIVSDPFTVDRTPPRLEVKRPSDRKEDGGRIVIELTATDASSPIARGEYSLAAEAGPWVHLPCRDGICDTWTESFRLEVAPPAAGAKIRFRVADAEGNVATVEAP